MEIGDEHVPVQRATFGVAKLAVIFKWSKVPVATNEYQTSKAGAC
jgi:hypothetical protein